LLSCASAGGERERERERRAREGARVLGLSRCGGNSGRRMPIPESCWPANDWPSIVLGRIVFTRDEDEPRLDLVFGPAQQAANVGPVLVHDHRRRRQDQDQLRPAAIE
jgi:hypothetical protein